MNSETNTTITEDELYWILSCSQNSHDHLRLGLQSQLDIEAKFRKAIPQFLQHQKLAELVQDGTLITKFADWVKDEYIFYHKSQLSKEIALAKFQNLVKQMLEEKK